MHGFPTRARVAEAADQEAVDRVVDRAAADRVADQAAADRAVVALAAVPGMNSHRDSPFLVVGQFERSGVSTEVSG